MTTFTLKSNIVNSASVLLEINEIPHTVDGNEITVISNVADDVKELFKSRLILFTEDNK